MLQAPKLKSIQDEAFQAIVHALGLLTDKRLPVN